MASQQSATATRPSKRDHLIDTALNLFYAQGYHATGIDEVIEVAGVAKMTLYNNFASKDDLLLAALQRRDEHFRSGLVEAVEASGDDVRDQLLTVFDVLDDFIHDLEFHGCMFVNISAEFAEHDHPIHQAAAAHKRIMTDYLAELAESGGIDDPRRLAEQLMVLFDGTIVTAQVSGPGSIDATRAVAEGLIDNAVQRA